MRRLLKCVVKLKNTCRYNKEYDIIYVLIYIIMERYNFMQKLVDMLLEDDYERKVEVNVNNWFAHYSGAIYQACIKDKKARCVKGYLHSVYSDGYSDYEICPELPVADCVKDTKEYNKKCRKYVGTKPVREQTKWLYGSYRFGNDLNMIDKFIQKLKEYIQQQGFSQYNVKAVKLDDILVHIIPNKILNSVKIVYEDTGITYAIWVEIKW